MEVECQPNPGYTARTGYIEFTVGTQSASAAIRQNGLPFIEVTEVKLNLYSVNLVLHDNLQLKATVSPDNATDPVVTWTSSDAGVVSVSEDGLIEALAAGGPVTITASAGSKSDQCTVNVLVPVTGVSLDQTELSLVEGDFVTLTATVVPESATDPAVTWKSSDESIATVSQDGLVRVVKPGNATVSVTTVDGGFSAACAVTVVPRKIPVEGVSVAPASATLARGESLQLSVSVSPADATDKSVVWQSSDSGIASVDKNGLVTAQGAGSAVISAITNDCGKKAYCGITVFVPVTGVTLSAQSLSLVEGDTETLVATVLPEDATDRSVTWVSSDASVVNVSSDGVVTALKVGSAQISVVTGDGGFKAFCNVSVSPKVIPVESISLNTTSALLLKGETLQLEPSFTPENATDQTIRLWQSSAPSVAYVDGNGLVMALAGGTATITAISNDGGKTASCAVEVRVPVVGVSLSEEDIAMYVDDVHQFAAAILPADATDTALFWSSSAPSVVSIDSQGIAIALAEGTSTITVTTHDGGFTASCEVVVKIKTVPLQSISIVPSEVEVQCGEEVQLAVEFIPENASDKSIKQWISGAPEVASVDMAGLVCAKSAGVAVIKAVSSDGGRTATCKVTVIPEPDPEPEMVDLGLKVKWATFNLGSKHPEDYGDYYAWGETEPKTDYTLDTYLWADGRFDRLTKYCDDNSFGKVDNKLVLELEDDAANARWGNPWRIPTTEEMTELDQNCDWTWTIKNGIYGYEVKARKYPYNSIFLPAAGYISESGKKEVGLRGVYMTSSAVSAYPCFNYFLYFSSPLHTIDSGDRYRGRSVRPVYGDGSAVVELTGLLLNYYEITIAVDESVQLTATPKPANATYPFFDWESENKSIATVDENGVVKGVGRGSTYIWVSSKSGIFKDFCYVTVVYKTPEAVDLGLSVKWASFNLGATKPREYGDYFSWGESAPKTYYNWSQYSLCDGAEWALTKYNSNSAYGVVDNLKTLLPEDDAATVNLKGSWRMPTKKELEELLNPDNCSWEWVKGDNYFDKGYYKVTSKKPGYKDASILIPAAGRSGAGRGSSIFMWTSSVAVGPSAYYLFGDSTEHSVSNGMRMAGFTVRPVTP